MRLVVDVDSFRRRFDVRWTPEPNTGCYLWTGATSAQGYGVTYVATINGSKLMAYAHRMAVELSGRRIKPGLTVDHLCRVRGCVNPAHLEVVTIKENWARRPRTSILRAARAGGLATAARWAALREVAS
jgi:hypothetical protein